jgi:cation transport ATPase
MKDDNFVRQNQAFAWVIITTGLLLALPWIAMQFTDEVNWTLSDFVVACGLLLSAGFSFVLIARKVRKRRMTLGLVLAVLVAYLWAELSVGIFTSLGN